MGYRKANDVLPSELLAILQDYIDGEYIYIPRKPCNKKSWGEITGSREATLKRNIEIYHHYLNGVSVMQLSDKYFLSDKAVYKVIAELRKTS